MNIMPIAMAESRSRANSAMISATPRSCDLPCLVLSVFINSPFVLSPSTAGNGRQSVETTRVDRTIRHLRDCAKRHRRLHAGALVGGRADQVHLEPDRAYTADHRLPGHGGDIVRDSDLRACAVVVAEDRETLHAGEDGVVVLRNVSAARTGG